MSADDEARRALANAKERTLLPGTADKLVAALEAALEQCEALAREFDGDAPHDHAARGSARLISKAITAELNRG